MTGTYAARGRVMIEVRCIGVRSGREPGLIQKELKPCNYEGAQKAIYSSTPCYNCIISCGFSFSTRRPQMEPSRYIARLMTRCDVYVQNTHVILAICGIGDWFFDIKILRPAHQLVG